MLNNSRLITIYVGYATLAGMLILSLCWWDLRIAFSDLAYQLTEILHHNSFAIQHNRFGEVIIQSFPLYASRMGLSLKGVAQAYSAGYVVIFIVSFSIALLLRSPRIALMLLISLLLMTTDTFFWTASDLLLGLALLCVGFALVEYTVVSGRRDWPMVLAVPTFVVAACIHPLAIFPFLFICAYLWLNNFLNFPKRHLVVCALAYLLAFVVKKYYFTSGYEAKAMEGLDRVMGMFPNYVNLDTNKAFFYNCFKVYYWFPICLLALNVFYLYRKRWLLLVLVNGFVAAYLLLINVSAANTNVLRFYIEGMYLPLAVFLATPLAFEIFPLLEKRRLTLPLALLISLTFFLRITIAKEPFEKRLDWITQFTDSHRHEKVMTANSALPLDTLMMTWGMPFEVWLVSMCKYGEAASFHNVDNIESWRWTLWRTDVWFTPWDVKEYKTLPKKYFNFRDSTTTYRVMEKL